MTDEEIIRKTAELIEKRGFDRIATRDYFQLILACKDEEMKKEMVTRLKKASEGLDRGMYWECLRREAPYSFESFMYFMERKRLKEDKFYEVRYNPLHEVAQGVQDLADDKLDELFVNLPPRTGKTTIVKLAMLWWGSRNTELSNLYTCFSDKISKAFYNGLTEFMTDPTYSYKEIFPKNKIVKTNGDDETIDLNRVKTYPTFTCRSLYGTLNGSCDCSGLAVADDLLSGIEEALSADRLETVWGKYDNNFMSRQKTGSKLINMGTRWALGDPQGRRQFLLENNSAFSKRRYRVVAIPALDENDESNFDYPYDKGFPTHVYLERRASFETNADEASWYAQYQQEPIDRQGALFSAANLKFYNGVLPEGEPDRIFGAVDEAFGGGDFVSMPIAFQYGDQIYIHDVVFNDGDKFVTRPLIADAIERYGIAAVQFEETKTTADYHEWIAEELFKRGVKCNITTKAAGTGMAKRVRIFDKAPEIREFYFRDNGVRNNAYQRFMSQLYEFKMEGKVKHDDAPDSLAQLCTMLIKRNPTTQIFNSPF